MGGLNSKSSTNIRTGGLSPMTPPRTSFTNNQGKIGNDTLDDLLNSISEPEERPTKTSTKTGGGEDELEEMMRTLEEYK